MYQLSRICIHLFLLCIPITLIAQEYEYDLSTPHNTVYTHLKYLQEESYIPQIAAKTLNTNSLKDEQLAIKLKQILDGKGLEVDLSDIPNINNYIDSNSKKSKYILFTSLPSVYLEKVNNKWLYSQHTVKKIPELHKEVFPFGTNKLVNLLPSNAHKKFMGLELWQYLGILILIIISFILHKCLAWIIDRVLLRVSIRFVNKDLTDKYIHPIAKPLSLFVIMLLISILFPILQLPITVSKYIFIALKILTPFYAILVFYRSVDLVTYYFQKFADRTESTLDDQLVPLVRRALKAFVVAIGILFILQNLDYNITALLAGISIGGLAFALAAQDTIKNLFGSIMIFVDRPFQVGDWIISPGIEGTVEEVGFRSTRVRTFYNSVTSIPNGKLADQAVDNMGVRIFRRFKTNIALTYDTPPEKIEVFIKELKELVKNHPKTRKDYFEIHMNEMADFSLNILFYIFFEVPSWTEELEARHEILLSILKLGKKIGIEFAFPTQTLHVERLSEK